MEDTPRAKLAKLEEIMKETALTVQENGGGVHPHIIGCWIRQIQEIIKLLS